MITFPLVKSPFGFDPLDDLGGIAADHHVIRHVLCDHGTGGDDDVVPDGDAGIDDGTSADPDVVTDGDGFAGLDAAVPLMGIDRVCGGIDMDAGGDEAVVSDTDLTDIKEDAVEVRVEIFSDINVGAVITAEARFDEKLVSGRTEEIADDGRAPVEVCHR